MTDDNEVYAAAQYREHQDGYGVRDADEHPHTGIVRDEMVSRFLSVTAEFYDVRETSKPSRMPGTYDGLEEVEQIRAIEGTETGRQALEDSDTMTLKHLTGDQQERADISGMKAIQEVDKILEDPAPVIVIIGDMGTGKTDLACLLAQRARHLLGIEKVASNIPTLKETDQWTDQDGEQRDGFVPNWRSMEEWVQQDGDPLEEPQQPKAFIGDEFSSGGDGTGKSGYLMRKKMGPLVFKIRKYDGLLIYVAHDESSIHPLLWRVGYVIKKTSKKQATIAEKIKNAEIRDKVAEIDGIPQTDWRYDTNDPAVWSWKGADSEDDENPDPGDVAYDVAIWTTIRGKQDGLSNREIAKFVPFSYEWVRTRWNEFKQEDMHTDTLAKVEDITA